MKSFIVIIIWTIVMFWFGAVSHENDLARNFNETGNAKAWFYEIKK